MLSIPFVIESIDQIEEGSNIKRENYLDKEIKILRRISSNCV